jgi:hypothetical protein
MIKVKRSKIKKKNDKEFIRKFSEMSIDQMIEKWIVPIYTKTHCEDIDPSKIPLQQTSIYLYLGKEIMKERIPEKNDLKLYLFEKFDLSPDNIYKIEECENIIFIHIFEPRSMKLLKNYGWNTFLNMFQFKQPDNLSYTNPYSSILHGYCIDTVYEEWYKQDIDTKIKLQNSDKVILLRTVFEICEKWFRDNSLY